MRAQTPLTAASEAKRPCEKADPALSQGTRRQSSPAGPGREGQRSAMHHSAWARLDSNQGPTDYEASGCEVSNGRKPASALGFRPRLHFAQWADDSRNLPGVRRFGHTCLFRYPDFSEPLGSSAGRCSAEDRRNELAGRQDGDTLEGAEAQQVIVAGDDVVSGSLYGGLKTRLSLSSLTTASTRVGSTTTLLASTRSTSCCAPSITLASFGYPSTRRSSARRGGLVTSTSRPSSARRGSWREDRTNQGPRR